MSVTWFFRSVMNKVFTYSNYELVNRVITLFLLTKLRYWASLEIVKSLLDCDGVAVDLGAGDGSMTRFLLKLGVKPRSILLVDPAVNGLLLMRDRPEIIDKVIAVGEALPLRSGSVCVIYTAFALRQFNDKFRAMIEARRVLRRCGSFIVLEFWRPDTVIMHAVLLYYLTLPLPLLVSLVAPRSIKEYLTMRRTIKGLGPISWLRNVLNKFVGDVTSYRKYMDIFVIIRARKC
ncbi:MAG: class I SAM-dependent methyltransferase [Vulcanisaeta sp.]